MDEGNPAELSKVISAGDIQKVDALIRAGADVHYTREGYDALLDAVCRLNAVQDTQLLPLLRLLVQHNVALNTITRYQESALRVLSRLGRFDGIALLLSAGADASQLEWTPLARATAIGSIDDMQRCLANGSKLEDRDWWNRTPYLIAIKTGDIGKAKLLLAAGANADATGRCGQQPLTYAITNGHTPMLNWLVENGADVALTCDFGTTYLMEAVRSDNAEAVRTLLQAGAQLSTRSKASATDYTLPDTIKLLRDFGGETALADEMTEMFAQLNEMASSGVPSAPTKTILPAADTWINNPVLSDARSAKVAKLLLDAGADPKDLNNAGQRLLMGYAAEPNPALLTNTPEQFFAARERVFGTNNPTKMQKPFWLAMIRAGLDSFRATERFDGPSSFDHTPVWCAQRFGQSITFLNDGRIVQIGGEHEDGYDPDFCIYNDVFVHQSENTTSPIIIYGYPEAIFPPTDFHTATLMGDAIIVIGGLGYHGTRVPSETRVFKLDIKTFAFSQILASGEAPGWIYSHRVDKVSATELRVRGGIIVTGNSGSETHADNTHEFVLNLRSGVWRRHTGCS